MARIPFSYDISRRHWIAAVAILAATAAVLLANGRPPICTCGYVALWHGAIDAGTSQHIADWYTLATSSTVSCSTACCGCCCASGSRSAGG